MIITDTFTRKDWALGIADAVAEASECNRAKVAAVVFDTNWRIIGAGYNGTRPGDGLSCARGDCPRGRHYRKPGYADEECQAGADCWDSSCTGWGHPGIHTGGLCACGNPWPCDEAVESGSSYDTGPGICISSHAELSAISDVEDRSRMNKGFMAVTAPPCDGCLKIINNTTRLAEVFWKNNGLWRPAT